MASSDNLLAYNWGGAAAYLPPAFSDTWNTSDMLTKETDTFARALQSTFTQGTADLLSSSEMMAMLMEESNTTINTTITGNKFGGPSTPTFSGGSENEISVVTRRGVPPPPTGRVSKRKSRSTKKVITTFFTADPASFRQMVQQITGIKGQGTATMEQEPQRVMPIPMLDTDTSAFFLNGVTPFLGTHQVLQQSQSSPAIDGAGGSGLSTAALDFDSFYSFPTLESWKAM